MPVYATAVGGFEWATNLAISRYCQNLFWYPRAGSITVQPFEFTPILCAAHDTSMETGKFKLFNRLSRTRDALVADYLGLTRAQKYGTAKFEELQFIVIVQHDINIGASIGVVNTNTPASITIDGMIEKADKLMYQQKQTGKKEGLR